MIFTSYFIAYIVEFTLLQIDKDLDYMESKRQTLSFESKIMMNSMKNNTLIRDLYDMQSELLQSKENHLQMLYEKCF